MKIENYYPTTQIKPSLTLRGIVFLIFFVSCLSINIYRYYKYKYL